MDSFFFLASPQNPRIKSAASLRDAKARRQSGLFLIDGIGLIERALQGGISLEQLFVRDDAASMAQVASLLANDPRKHLESRCFRVAPGAMEKLQYGQRDLGVIGVAQVANTDLDGFSARVQSRFSEIKRSDSEQSREEGSRQTNPCFLVLDRIEKPGNLGAALRTADGAGVTGVLLADPICDVWNPNAVRSSLGALFTVPIAIASEAAMKAWLAESNIQVFAARVEGSKIYTAANFRQPHAIVIGNEAEGLQHRWLDPSIEPISIPMSGVVDSLNASVSTAVALYESKRQNGASITPSLR